MLKTLPVLLLAAMLAACQTAPVIDLAAETRALLATDEAFAKLSEQRNPKAAFAAFMAPDGMMLPAAMDGAITGYESVIAAFGEADDPGFDLYWDPQLAEVSATADLGWTWGTYRYLVNGQEIRRGKYLNVWKKQPDGQWKVRVDVGNQRPQQE
jgi:ketosteroid isomerase-like protein